MIKHAPARNSRHPEISGNSPVADLQRLGFSEYEGCTYLSLLQNSPATAYEVSKQAGLPRANIYGALESLTKKRAVQPVSENPTRYVPVDPATLLGRISTDVHQLCERLQETLETIEPNDNPDVVWSIDGEEQISAKIDEIIDLATEHVWIKASTDVLQRHAPALKLAAARGVKLVLVVFGDDIKFLRFGKNTRIYLHEGNGQRVGGADNLFTIAIDYRIALTANLGETLTGAYTTHPAIVRMAETLIRHDVYMAEMMMFLGKEIEERFGKGLIELRRSLFSPKQLAELQSNLDKMNRTDAPV